MSECRKDTREMVIKVDEMKSFADRCLGEYIKEYSTYGFDDVASGLLNVIAELEVISCKLRYAEIRERVIPI